MVPDWAVRSRASLNIGKGVGGRNVLCFWEFDNEGKGLHGDCHVAST